MRTWFSELLGEAFGIRRNGFELVRVNAVATSAVTLTINTPQFVPYNATGGAFTITLPAAPYEGLQFNFSENAGSATALTIDGNGKNIVGAGTMSRSTAYQATTLRYNGTQWITV